MTDVVDTTWDQIAGVLKIRVEQIAAAERARHVKLLILRSGEQDIAVVTEGTVNATKEGARGEEWIKRFREYAESHAPLGHEVDDSRESIYAEAVRDIG